MICVQNTVYLERLSIISKVPLFCTMDKFLIWLLLQHNGIHGIDTEEKSLDTLYKQSILAILWYEVVIRKLGLALGSVLFLIQVHMKVDQLRLPIYLLLQFMTKRKYSHSRLTRDQCWSWNIFIKAKINIIYVSGYMVKKKRVGR